MVEALLIFSLITSLLLVACSENGNPVKDVLDIYLGLLGLAALAVLSVVLVILYFLRAMYRLLTTGRIWK